VTRVRDYQPGERTFEAPGKPASAAVSGPTGEGMALAHAKAWRLFTAKTPRERLAVKGWAVNDDGDWEGPDHVCDLRILDGQTLRDLAAVADDGVTP
jgi:hypothetical protein